MRTTLKGDNNDETEVILEISDDDFDVPGWISLTIKNETIELPTKDLLAAIIGFDAKNK